MTSLRNIALCAAMAALAAHAAPEAPPREWHPVGEAFTFKAYALGFLPIGTVWMDTGTGAFESTPTYTFHGRCYGDYLLYKADVHVYSHLSQYTDQSLFHAIEQYGTERRGRRLTFDWTSNIVTYVRLERDNKTYKLRRVVAVTPDVWDVFGCAFHARRQFPTNVGESTDVKLIETEKVFHLRCTVMEKRPYRLPGVGVVEAMRVQLSPVNLRPDEVFKGLLNLDRDVVIWIETSTRTPVYMSTTVPFGIIRPKVEVVMREWKRVPGFEPTVLPDDALAPH